MRIMTFYTILSNIVFCKVNLKDSIFQFGCILCMTAAAKFPS